MVLEVLPTQAFKAEHHLVLMDIEITSVGKGRCQEEQLSLAIFSYNSGSQP